MMRARQETSTVCGATILAPMWSGASTGARDLLTAVVRCWRSARDGGAQVQQSLHRLLAPHGCEMLAPVFDSLMTLYEDALGRRIVPGEGRALSLDEQILLGFLDGSKSRRACIDCAEGAASSLDCAICSTRIMMALAIEAPASTAMQ